MKLLKRFFFPIMLSLALVGGEVCFDGWMMGHAPKGMRWLGDTFQSQSDAAVYQSYLRQGAEGHVLLDNLYAIEPHAKRLDGFWSVWGMVARTGMPILVVHELAKALGTVVLVFAVWLAARRNGAATVLAFLGMGGGWMYSSLVLAAGSSVVEVALQGNFSLDHLPDFSLAPQLTAGAHIVWSSALLILGLRMGWESIAEGAGRTPFARTGRMVGGAICFAALFTFHPYLMPVVGIFLVSGWVVNRKERFIWQKMVLFGFAFVPGLLIYVPLLIADQAFQEHQQLVNKLPLPGGLALLMTLLPCLIAGGWRYWKKIRLEKEEYWLVAWLGAMLVSIVLPVPWTRKLLEGGNVALVLLTWPFWKMFSRRILLWGLAGATAVTLLAIQWLWIRMPILQESFYVRETTVQGWQWLAEQTNENAIVVADTHWLNVWTPAYSGRRVWLGHLHETPRVAEKTALWNELLTTTSTERAEAILHEAGVTEVLLSSASTTLPTTIGKSWKEVFGNEGVRIFQRK